MRARHRLLVAIFLAALVACAAPSTPEPPAESTAQAEPPPDATALDAAGLFLQPNVLLPDGALGYVHVTEADMPLRIAIASPPSPPKYASTAEAREIAIEAMRMWERAIQPHVPWFRLEFVERDETAAVQVEWKRRITGPFAGFGEIRHRIIDGVLRVGGRMEVSTTPSQFTTLEIDDVRLLVAHEFGHVLGLGHCLDCDSAMNYAYHTRDRVLVTAADVNTFLALLAQPNLSVAVPIPSARSDAATR